MLLSCFEASLAECTPADYKPDIDVSDLRVEPLQKELEAVSRDAAAGIIPVDAPEGGPARPIVEDGAAAGTRQYSPADSGDAAAPAGGDTVLLLEGPPSGEAEGPAQQAPAEGPPQQTRTRSSQRATPDGAHGSGDPPQNFGAAAEAEKPAPAGAARQAGPGGVGALGGAGPTPPTGVHAVGRQLQMHSASDGRWRAGKVTHFNRRSGKHSVLFEDGSVNVMDLAADLVVFPPEDEPDEETEDEGTRGDADDGAALVEGTGAPSDAAPSGVKRSASTIVVHVPPPKRCTAYAAVTVFDLLTVCAC